MKSIPFFFEFNYHPFIVIPSFTQLRYLRVLYRDFLFLLRYIFPEHIVILFYLSLIDF